MFQRKRGFLFPTITKHCKNIIFLLLLFTSIGFAQTRQQLEEDRMRIIQDIVDTDKILKQTKRTKNAALEDLKGINSQIDNRQSLINNIQSQLKNSDQYIQNFQEIIDTLNLEFGTIENNYALFLKNRYRQSQTRKNWMYLLNSNSINVAFKKWLYLKQFEKKSREQALLLAEKNKELAQSITAINDANADKISLLSAEKKHFDILEQEKNQKESLVSSIKEEEEKFKSIIKTRKKEREQLNTSIENFILRQIDGSNPITTAPTYTQPKIKKPPVVSGFGNSKGKLKWPVSNGFVSSKFGKQRHPSIKNLEISNNGIDIRTGVGAEVQAVFSGTVLGITEIPGFNTMIIIQHGNFYSVYSKLDEIYISIGDQIKLGQAIGKLYIDKNQQSELHFEIWKNKIKLNPQSWLSRK